MSRESTYASIILKKTPYGEADELITIYTKELGKLRVLAKSVKFSKSKLQYGLQLLFLVNITTTRGNLPKIIGAEIVNSFSNIRENLEAARMAMYATELVLKFTPDEQKNEQLFNSLVEFLDFLNVNSGPLLRAGLEKFKIAFLENLGFGIAANAQPINQSPLSFSNSRGGFITEQTGDGMPVSSQTYADFWGIRLTPFRNLHLKQFENLDELHQILSGFLQYQLEREIKSEQFLNL